MAGQAAPGGAGVKAMVMCAVVLGMLAACGKKGPPDPPGPPDKINYPKTYPTH